MDMQKNLLADTPRIQRIYEIMSDSIHEVAMASKKR